MQLMRIFALFAQIVRDMEMCIRDRGSGELKQMEQQLADAGKNIPEEVLKDYHRIKTFRPDPVARLCDNRCDGCKIGLPSGVAASVANSDHLVPVSYTHLDVYKRQIE